MPQKAKDELSICPELTLEMARELIAEYDLDNDGKLCFEEFVKCLMDERE